MSAALLLMLVLVTAMGRADPVNAAPPTGETATALPAAQLDALAATLADETRRNELIATIRALAEAQRASKEAAPVGLGERLLLLVTEAATEVGKGVGDLGHYFRDLFVLGRWLRSELTDPAARARGLEEMQAFVTIFAAGLGCELLCFWLLSGVRRRLGDGARSAAVTSHGVAGGEAPRTGDAAETGKASPMDAVGTGEASPMNDNTPGTTDAPGAASSSGDGPAGDAAPVRKGVAAARSGLVRTPFIIGHFAVELLPLLVFAAAAYAAALTIQPVAVVKAVGLNFVHAYLAARVMFLVARLCLAPEAPALRLLPLGSEAARHLYRWVRRFVLTAVVGYFLIAAATLSGLPRRGADVALRGLGLVLAVLAIGFILRNRRPIADWLRRQSEQVTSKLGAAEALQALAAVWHILAVAYVAGFFVIAAFAIENGLAFMLRGTLISVAVVLGAWLVLLAIRQLLFWLAGAADAADRPLWQVRVSPYLAVVRSMAQIVVFVVATVILLDGWGLGTLAWLNQPLGRRMLGAATSILLVLGFAVLVWELAGTAIERYLAPPEATAAGAARSARARTLLPLMRKFLFGLLSVMVVLISLSELGINIAPLLAGAGVVGLAIGFGAQKLVQDLITGIFILVEDAIAVGDVVTVAGRSGVVEDLSIRSIRLRDLAGIVHTIPFSTVDTVSNMTKEYSYYVLDIGIDYGEDPNRVAAICRDVVEQMRSEPAFAYDILEPLEVFGVDQFAESAVVVKARIKTRASRQWAVGREFNGRMKQRFAEEGVNIPYPHRTIYVNVDSRESALPLRVALDGMPESAPVRERRPLAAPFAARPPRRPRPRRVPPEKELTPEES